MPGRDGVKIVVRSGPVFLAVSPWGRPGPQTVANTVYLTCTFQNVEHQVVLYDGWFSTISADWDEVAGQTLAFKGMFDFFLLGLVQGLVWTEPLFWFLFSAAEE